MAIMFADRGKEKQRFTKKRQRDTLVASHTFSSAYLGVVCCRNQ